MTRIIEIFLIPLTLIFIILFMPIYFSEAFILILLFIGILTFIFEYFKISCKLRYLVYLAFLMRIVLVMLDDSYHVLPEQADENYYDIEAERIIENINNNVSCFHGNEITNSVKSYSLFISFIYRIFGNHSILVKLFNSFFGILICILIYLIALQLFENNKIAAMACVSVLFLPSFLVFNSYMLRDTIIILFSLLMIYNINKLIKYNFNIFSLITVVISFLTISILRVQNLYLYSLIIISWFLFYGIAKLRSNSKKLIFVISMFLVILIVFSLYKELLIQAITYPFRAQPLRNEGGSAYLQSLSYDSYIDLLKYLPIRFIYFTFGPFIWNAAGAFQTLAALEGIIILFTFYFSLKYIFSNIDNQNKYLILFLIIFSMFGLLANSTVDSNFGTAVRHRIDYVIFLFIFASAYLYNYTIKFY